MVNNGPNLVNIVEERSLIVLLFIVPAMKAALRPLNTVGINPRLIDLKGPGTSKLDWRYLEHNKIDRNELQVCTNSQKGTRTRIAEKLNNFEKFERKKGQISALFLTQTS